LSLIVAAKTGVFTIHLSKYHDTMATAPRPPQLQENPDPHQGDNPDTWRVVPQMLREMNFLLPAPWEEVFGPLRRGMVDDMVVVAQCGQSIDARIATASGHSHYINGPEGLAHLHRLRALVDAVVVGVGTALADDPQLTVRRVVGPNPARVVLDPNGRLAPTARVLADDGVRRLVVTKPDTSFNLPAGIEMVRLAALDGALAPSAILAALAERGLGRVLIEGGSNTVSRFLAAGCLDRVHVVIAPMIIGAGPSSISLPPIDRVDEAIRAPMRVHRLGDDVLLDCDLSAQRIGIGSAKKSM
jgi:riboflavin-specific deaminase-like protein